MIFKDGKQYKLSNKDKELVKKYTDDKGVLELVWDDQQYRVNPTLARDKVGKFMNRKQLSDPPPSLPIFFRVTSYEPNGDKVEVIFAEMTSQDPNTGVTLYEPRQKVMSNMLSTNDQEFIFFLVQYSPVISNNEAAEHWKEKNPNHTFYLKIDRPVAEAELLLKNEAIMDTAKGLIREKMSIDQLVDIALLLKISGADKMQATMLRARMLSEVALDPQNIDPYHKYKSFLEKAKKFTKADKHEIAVQKLIDKRAISYNSQSHAWVELDAEGETKSVIKSLRANQDNNARNILIRLYAKDKGVQDKLDGLLKGLEKEPESK